MAELVKKNILFLIVSLTGGGAEKVAANLSLKLAEKHNVTVALSKDNGGEKNYAQGGDVVILNNIASNNFFAKTYRFVSRIFKTRKLKKDKNINVSISFLEMMNVPNLLSIRKEKVIISERAFRSNTNTPKYISDYLYNLLIKIIYNKADIVVVPSIGIGKDLVGNFNVKESKIKLIYNPYDCEKIEQLAKEDIEEKYLQIFKSPVIISVGELSERKGYWHLIRIFSRCKKYNPSLKLVLLGQGKFVNYFSELSTGLGLNLFNHENNNSTEPIENYDVYLLGFKSNPFKYIKRSKIFAFSSLVEGFPNALVEAMATGITVVSSDCRTGPREILAADTDPDYETNTPEFTKCGVLMPVLDGRFYTAKDPLTQKEIIWADTFLQILGDEKVLLEFALQGIRRSNDFHINKIATQWEEIL